MSASLVGSEMCIRDSDWTTGSGGPIPKMTARHPAASEGHSDLLIFEPGGPRAMNSKRVHL
eukprot:1482082-Alexandrium_andersonii.AAC.1